MRGKIVHYNPNEGKGLIAAEDHQFAFAISQWRSEVAPAVNQTVDFEPNDQGEVTGLRLVDAQALAKERLTQLAGSAGTQGHVATALAGQVRQRMGTVTMVVATVLLIGWFFLPALTVSFGFGISKSFSISDILGLQLSSSGATSSFGFFAFLGFIAVLAPWASAWMRQRWATLLNTAPLVMLILSFVRVRWELHSLVSQAIDAAGAMGGGQAAAMAQGMADQMADQISKAVSFGFGFWLVLLLSLALAIIGFKRFTTHA